MYKLLLLLLPLAAASGWWGALRSQRRAGASTMARDPAYFRGLNYVLNEQPDQAIDVFIKLLEVDSETVETHLALGNLFRRRGEVERAIRLHQNLIARPHLGEEQRALALLELGQDYLRAGLLDRAASLFQELVDLGWHRERALINLKEIYQQEKDWVHCLDVARQLVTLGESSQAIDIAHYHCEQAEIAQASGDSAGAWTCTRAALAADPQCVRASLLQAALHRAQTNWPAVIACYRHAMQQDADWLGEVLPGLIDAYRQLGNMADLASHLQELYAAHSDTRVLLALVDVVCEQRGMLAAEALLIQHVRQRADLLGMERFVNLRRECVDSPDAAQDILEILQLLLRRLLDRQPAYQCSNCGFLARHLHWQCPSCKGWSSLRPVAAHAFDI